jgi:hypothetical protein
MDKKEIEDALMDMELFKPDDVFYERVFACLHLMLHPVAGQPQIRHAIRGMIMQYLLDAKLMTHDQIPKEKV